MILCVCVCVCVRERERERERECVLHLVHTLFDEFLHDLVEFVPAARGPQHRPAPPVDLSSGKNNVIRGK